MSVINDIRKEFPQVSEAQWKALFLKETKQENTAPHVSVLGFDFLPFYASGDYEQQRKSIQTLLKQKESGWNITREFNVNDPNCNQQILKSLEKGISSVTLKGNIESEAQLDSLLKGVLANFIEINFNSTQVHPEFASWYHNWCKKNNHGPQQVFGTIYQDAISHCLRSGGWKHNREKDLQNMFAAVDFTQSNFGKVKSIVVDAGTYHYAGADLLQTLAYTVSHALTYVEYGASKNVSPEKVISSITFHWPVGIHFFGEIAALRALHYIWNSVCRHITGKKDAIFPLQLSCETSFMFWSQHDLHNNMLRATTQAMAAVCGGATTVLVHPYNVLINKDDAFADRIATNTQLLLREESFLDKTIDPAGGSHFAEALTHQLAENALDLIKKINAGGGLIKEITSGKIQQEIHATAKKLTNAFQAGHLKIVGSNLYACKEKKFEPMRPDLFQPLKEKEEIGVLTPFVLEHGTL